MLVLYVPLGCNSTYKQPYSLEVPQATQYQTPILILGRTEIDQATHCTTWLLMEEIWLTSWYSKYSIIYRVYNPTWLGIVEISPWSYPQIWGIMFCFILLGFPILKIYTTGVGRNHVTKSPTRQFKQVTDYMGPKITYHSWATNCEIKR